jgi:hypothetical protein
MQKPANPTPDDIRRISDLITAANTVGGKAVEFSAERLKTCVAIGEQFIEWKKLVGHGKWEAFAAEHFPQLPASTRGRWQQLAAAKQSGRLDLSSARGLRHAYILAGIIPDTEPAPKDGGCEEEPASYLIHIARTQAALARIALDELAPEQAALLKERLRPIVALFYKLDADIVYTA